MVIDKTIASLRELPHQINAISLLDRLKDEICAFYALDYPHQSNLSKNSSNPKTGYFSFTINPFFKDTSIIDIVEFFYHSEGFNVHHRDGGNVVDVEKGREKYTIYIEIDPLSYSLWIDESPLNPQSIN